MNLHYKLAPFAFVLFCGVSAAAHAQDHGHMHMKHGAQDGGEEESAERKEKMRERMEEMHQRMAKMNQELQQKLEAMEQAEGEKRIDAMAAVIRTLVEQRTQMHEQHQEMMQKKDMGRGMMMHGK